MKENMTILLYEHYGLEERASSHLRVWKAWHTVLFLFAAIFGILNYTFLQNAMQLVEDRCILYPAGRLKFEWVELTVITDAKNAESFENTDLADNVTKTRDEARNGINKEITTNFTLSNTQSNASAVQETVKTQGKTVKREVIENKIEVFNETTNEFCNVTVITENSTSRLFLDIPGSPFVLDSHCQFPEYMPLVSAVFAVLWATLFLVCPGGGRSSTSSGLQQSWRILTPALLFSLVMVGLTGHSFTTSNGGLQAFCAAFCEVTNTTTCSAVNRFLPLGWNATWGIGGRVAATRAAAAGAWVSWACAAALLLARCLTAPDFAVRRTEVRLKDPRKKITPYLLKATARQPRSALSSPSKRDTVSVKSEPTTSTELMSSVYHGPDSAPTSLVLPVRRQQSAEEIELAYKGVYDHDHR